MTTIAYVKGMTFEQFERFEPPASLRAIGANDPKSNVCVDVLIEADNAEEPTVCRMEVVFKVAPEAPS